MNKRIPKEVKASTMLTFKLILLLNNNWKEYKECGKFEVRDIEIREVGVCVVTERKTALRM